MGAWGVGTFENDSALDWMQDLIESDDLKSLKKMLKTFDQPRGVLRIFSSKKEQFIDEDQASSGLVAGEVIAAIMGSPSNDLPDELIKWIQENSLEVSRSDIELAKIAIKKIKEDSELKELWEESDEYSEWIKSVENLEERLSFA